jgi:hypothetical protein
VIAVAMDLLPMKTKTKTASLMLTGRTIQSRADKKQSLPWLLTNYKKETQNGTTTNQLSKTV